MRKLLFALTLAMPFAAHAGDTNLDGRIVTQTAYGTVPTCSTASGDGDVCVGDALETVGAAVIGGTLTSTGAMTATGGITLGGNLTAAANKITGQLQGFEDLTSDQALDATDCGAVVSTNDDNRVITLPAVAAGNLGCILRIVNTAADDAALISISPNASDGIYGTCCGVDDAATTACVHLSGTDNKDAQNTKATQNKGDNITLVSDGSTGWYVLSCVGIWASEA